LIKDTPIAIFEKLILMPFQFLAIVGVASSLPLPLLWKRMLVHSDAYRTSLSIKDEGSGNLFASYIA
jgi:hypothetical protein